MDPVLLADMLDRTRHVRMTERERELQRMDFAYGNARIENAAVTFQMVRDAAQKVRRVKG